MNIYDEINLPPASKQLISLVLKKGGKINPISGTNAYLVKFRGKEYVFLGEFTPITPYMYGIVFSNQKYWFEIVKGLKMKHSWEPKLNQKRILFLMTRDGNYNALLEKQVTISGNGKDNLKKLIKTENIRRINYRNTYIMPVRIINKKIDLSVIPGKNEQIPIVGVFDYEDITKKLNNKYITAMKKILNFLPGLPFMRLEMFVKNPVLAGPFTLGKVSVSPGINIFFKLFDRKRQKDAGKSLLLLMNP